jgi:hypothetical protein
MGSNDAAAQGDQGTPLNRILKEDGEAADGHETETLSPDLAALDRLLRYAWTEAVGQSRDLTAALIVNAIAALSDETEPVIPSAVFLSENRTRH